MNTVRSHFALLVALFVFGSTMATAQSVYTPEKGSAERKAILDALRPPVERDLKQSIVFVTDHFSVQGNWAFVTGRPAKPDGSRPDLSKTAWAGQEDIFDDNFFGLLRKTNGKWRVVKVALGCTDVCYLDWPKRYKAPKQIFPFG